MILSSSKLTLPRNSFLTAKRMFAFSPSITATYTVTESDLNGCENSDSITVKVNTCASLKEDTNNNPLFIYPNPTSVQLNISGLEMKQQVILITNIISEVIKTIDTAGTKAISIDIENLSPGVYFINCNNKSIKFIRE